MPTGFAQRHCAGSRPGIRGSPAKPAPERGYFPLDPDTSMNPSSWKAALHAAGAVVEATDRVIGGALANAFCAVRPPGITPGRGPRWAFAC